MKVKITATATVTVDDETTSLEQLRADKGYDAFEVLLMSNPDDPSYSVTVEEVKP